MENQVYSLRDGGRFEATLAKLQLFGPETVRDIVDLVQYRGSALIDDVAASRNAGPPSVLAVLEPSFTPYKDAANVASGLGVLLLDAIRKPKYGNDEYQQILERAFSLPTALAKKYADQIETYDAIGDGLASNPSAQKSFWQKMQSYYFVVEEGARRLTNGLSNTLGLNTIVNFDQTQKYDVDFLFEVSELGRVANLMQSRNRLGLGWAAFAQMINGPKAQATAGDPEEAGDPSSYLKAFSQVGRGFLPKMLLGPFAPLVSSMATKWAEHGAHGLQKAGMAPGSTGPIGEDGHNLAAALRQGGAGAASGDVMHYYPNGDPLLPSMNGDSTPQLPYGDPEHESLIGDIAEDWGDDVANAFALGDIETIVGDVVSALQEEGLPEETGDPEDGDVMEMGFLKRLRTRMKLNQARRRRRRARRRRARQARRDLRDKQLQDAQMQAERAGFEEDFEGESQPQPDLDQNEGEGGGGDGSEGGNGNSEDLNLFE